MAALAVIAAVELVVWRIPALSRYLGRFAAVADTTDPLRVRGALRRQVRPGAEVIAFLGTSQVARGVDEAAVDAAAGGRIDLVNLGISGGAPIDLLWIGERLDDLGPRRVLVSFLSIQMNEPPKAEFMDLPIALAIARREGLWGLLDGDEVMRTNLRQGAIFDLLPTLRLRRALPRALAVWGRAAIDERSVDPTPPDLYVEGAHDGAAMAELLASGRTRGAKNQYWELNWWAADRLLARLRAAGYEVVYVAMPSHPDYRRTVDPTTAAEFDRRLAELCARHGVRVLDASSLARFEAGEFYDFVHLTRAGRARLSQALGEWLGR